MAKKKNKIMTDAEMKELKNKLAIILPSVGAVAGLGTAVGEDFTVEQAIEATGKNLSDLGKFAKQQGDLTYNSLNALGMTPEQGLQALEGNAKLLDTATHQGIQALGNNVQEGIKALGTHPEAIGNFVKNLPTPDISAGAATAGNMIKDGFNTFNANAMNPAVALPVAYAGAVGVDAFNRWREPEVRKDVAGEFRKSTKRGLSAGAGYAGESMGLEGFTSKDSKHSLRKPLGYLIDPAGEFVEGTVGRGGASAINMVQDEIIDPVYGTAKSIGRDLSEAISPTEPLTRSKQITSEINKNYKRDVMAEADPIIAELEQISDINTRDLDPQERRNLAIRAQALEETLQGVYRRAELTPIEAGQYAEFEAQLVDGDPSNDADAIKGKKLLDEKAGDRVKATIENIENGTSPEGGLKGVIKSVLTKENAQNLLQLMSGEGPWGKYMPKMDTGYYNTIMARAARDEPLGVPQVPEQDMMSLASQFAKTKSTGGAGPNWEKIYHDDYVKSMKNEVNSWTNLDDLFSLGTAAYNDKTPNKNAQRRFVYMIAKLNDPGGRVTDADYDYAADSGGWMDTISKPLYNLINGWYASKVLTKNEVQQMLRAGVDGAKAGRERAKTKYDQHFDKARSKGFKDDFIRQTITTGSGIEKHLMGDSGVSDEFERLYKKVDEYTVDKKAKTRDMSELTNDDLEMKESLEDDFKKLSDAQLSEIFSNPEMVGELKGMLAVSNTPRYQLALHILDLYKGKFGTIEADRYMQSLGLKERE